MGTVWKVIAGRRVDHNPLTISDQIALAEKNYLRCPNESNRFQLERLVKLDDDARKDSQGRHIRKYPLS